MKKILLLIVIIPILSTLAQPTGMVGETFNLKSIVKNNKYFTPNGESPNLTIYELPTSHVLDADGINNTLNAGASFNGNTMTLNSFGITLQDCDEPNCYFEDLYFYEILTNQNLESKTFTYYYNENNGYKYLRLKDTGNNWANFSTEPAPEPDPMIFQTWYLYRVDVDLGDPIFYTGPNPPQITINQDFTYTGIEDCAVVNGDFILGNGDEYYDFILQSRNYAQDETDCPPGPVTYTMWELEIGLPLGSSLYQGNDGNEYFQFETSPGFISHFRNVLLSTPENNLSGLKIFPNPAQNTLLLQSSNNDLDSVSISDVNGRMVISLKKLTSNEIDVSALKPGIYFITIQSSEGNLTKKFIKN